MSLRTPALVSTATAVLAAATVSPAAASPVSLTRDARAHAAPTAITPPAWFVDHTQRRVFTVALDRPLCHGSVDVTLYGPGGKLVDWLYQPVSSCRTSVVLDDNLYDWEAVGALGAGSAKVEVSDYDAPRLENVVRSFPFGIKTAVTQSVAASRSGRYVTVSGTTNGYVLGDGWNAHWAPVRGVNVQVQRLSGRAWKSVGNVKTNARGVASLRFDAPTKATYRLVYAGTRTQASAASGTTAR